VRVQLEATGKGATKWIKLRFYYKGRKMGISTGLSWNPVNIALAQSTANAIVTSIYQNQFDESLVKYRPLAIGRNQTGIPVVELSSQAKLITYVVPNSRRIVST